jgi:hypothetical protein
VNRENPKKNQGSSFLTASRGKSERLGGWEARKPNNRWKVWKAERQLLG